MRLQLKTLLKKINPNTIFSIENNNNISISSNVLNYDNCNQYTNGEFFFLASYAKNFKLCIDIGANVGDYAQKICSLNHQCRVICFEPNFALKDKITSKGVKEVYCYAVGSKSKMVTLNINVHDSTQSSIYRKNNNTIPFAVRSISMDDFTFKHGLTSISFMKIDTEGNELDVLKGCRNLIMKNAIDFIQFEYGGTYLDANTTLKDIYTLLKKNYIICRLLPNGLLPLEYSPKLENFRYSNWIAISRTGLNK